jgi:GR25 family glycosyltransferase involved in LPS biosynthesis
VLNEIFDRIVVLNLDKRTDRLEHFDKQAKELGITYERFAAYEGDPPKFLYRDACKKGHQEIMKQALDDGIKSLLIFEDDALFVEDFNNKFADVYSRVPDDWDMLYLGAWHHHFKPQAEGVVKMVDSFSAHAYGIRGRYLPKAYNATFHVWPVDIALASQHPHIKAYCAKPALVGQMPGYSDIDREYRDVTDKYL